MMEGTDVCCAPGLDFLEAQSHPHNVARKTYVEVDGMIQPAPAPRFSRTESEIQYGAKPNGKDTDSVLLAHGFSEEEIAGLREAGAVT